MVWINAGNGRIFQRVVMLCLRRASLISTDCGAFFAVDNAAGFAREVS